MPPESRNKLSGGIFCFLSFAAFRAAAKHGQVAARGKTGNVPDQFCRYLYAPSMAWIRSTIKLL